MKFEIDVNGDDVRYSIDNKRVGEETFLSVEKLLDEKDEMESEISEKIRDLIKENK